MFRTKLRDRCGSRLPADRPATRPGRSRCQVGPTVRARALASAMLLSGASLVSPSGIALADPDVEDLKHLRAAIQKELASLKKQEQKLHQEFLRLDQKNQLLDQQLRNLRATGFEPGSAPAYPPSENSAASAPNTTGNAASWTAIGSFRSAPMARASVTSSSEPAIRSIPARAAGRSLSAISYSRRLPGSARFRCRS